MADGSITCSRAIPSPPAASQELRAATMWLLSSPLTRIAHRGQVRHCLHRSHRTPGNRRGNPCLLRDGQATAQAPADQLFWRNRGQYVDGNGCMMHTDCDEVDPPAAITRGWVQKVCSSGIAA